jgi:hypothetical protein
MTPMQTKTTADFFRSLLPEEVKKTKKQIINHIEMSCQKYSKNTSLRLVISIAKAGIEVKTRQHKVTKNRADLLKYFINKIVDCLSQEIILEG